MASELGSLRAEVAALRAEVRHKRRRGRLWPVAIVAALVALIPLATLAANPFRDLVPGSVHNGNIDAIYNAKITTGCVPNQSYCPNDLVTRQEMASFLARTAGLGGNPPVANALSAQNAVNAQTAANANTLNGFSANGLARVNGASQGDTPLTVTTAYNTYTTVSIAAPGPGFVYLTGAITVYATSPSNAFVSAVILDPVTGFGNYEQSAVVGTTSGAAFAATISPTIIFPVPAAGTRTYLLIAGKDPASSGTTAATSATLSAIFVPFGPGGAVGSEQTTPTKQITDPPARP